MFKLHQIFSLVFAKFLAVWAKLFPRDVIYATYYAVEIRHDAWNGQRRDTSTKLPSDYIRATQDGKIIEAEHGKIGGITSTKLILAQDTLFDSKEIASKVLEDYRKNFISLGNPTLQVISVSVVDSVVFRK